MHTSKFHHSSPFGTQVRVSKNTETDLQQSRCQSEYEIDECRQARLFSTARSYLINSC
jgi:hypothetical protein